MSSVSPTVSPDLDALWPGALAKPRVRVITDNDYAGDPDGLVQLVHLLLSPTADVCGIIASHFKWFTPGGLQDTADRGLVEVRDFAARCGRSEVECVAGSNTELGVGPVHADAASEMIVHEAMEPSNDLPLFVTSGGSLTSVARAWKIEPRIAERLTLMWIGGHEHDGLAEPPLPDMDLEYNTMLDVEAARIVFNESDLRVWQIPRDVYRRVLVSRAELLTRLATCSPLGRVLVERLGSVVAMASSMGLAMGETYVLGDSPLVLPALMTAFEPGPASSRWVTMKRPRLLPSGLYEPNPDGVPHRVFTDVDTRLLYEDLIAKLTLHGR